MDDRKSNEPEDMGDKNLSLLSRSHYYPQLTYLDNLRLNLMSYQSHINKGLTTADLQ